MQKKSIKYFVITGILSLLFVLLIIMIKTVDVQPIGPQQSMVGLASMNRFVFDFFGVNLLWYDITEWMGYVAMATALGLTILGVFQLIKGKSIKNVDCRILLLGAFYFIVIAVYVFFELVIVNYRPILISQNLEASFPSSHAMIVICIMVTAMLQYHHYLRNKKLWLWAADIFSVLIVIVTVIGRLISGVHWFTDMIAGVILSSALVVLYYSILKYIEEMRSKPTCPVHRATPYMEAAGPDCNQNS